MTNMTSTTKMTNSDKYRPVVMNGDQSDKNDQSDQNDNSDKTIETLKTPESCSFIKHYLAT